MHASHASIHRISDVGDKQTRSEGGGIKVPPNQAPPPGHPVPFGKDSEVIDERSGQ